MTAGMAEVIAAHNGYDTHWEALDRTQVWYVVCNGCGLRLNVIGRDAPAETYAAHAAGELAKAGYGNIPDALREAAGEMPIETLGGADSASVWLRERAKEVGA